jgi:hypothetical protein
MQVRTNMDIRRESLVDNPNQKYESINKGPFQSFDLSILIERMKQSPYMQGGELNAMILLKSPEKQIVLTVFHSDSVIEENKEGHGRQNKADRITS